MKFDGIVRWFFRIGTWLARLMLLNVLWFLFTLLGFGVLGFFPATLSLVNVMYRWFDEDTEIQIFKTFYTFYKSIFIRSNLIGLIVVLLSAFLYLDIRISQLFIGSYFFHSIILLLTFVFLIVCLYLLTVFSRYELTFFQYFKQAFLLTLSRPTESIAMILSLILTYILFSNFPGLLVYFGVSLTLLPIVWFSYQGCLKAEKKRLELKREKQY